MMKECFFEKKKRFDFLKPFLQKSEGAKYAGGSRPSCNTLIHVNSEYNVDSGHLSVYIKCILLYLIDAFK